MSARIGTSAIIMVTSQHHQVRLFLQGLFFAGLTVFAGCGSVPPRSNAGAPAADPPESVQYQPCAGKTCGETCRVCPPDARDCMETQELKLCNAHGECTSSSETGCEETSPDDENVGVTTGVVASPDDSTHPGVPASPTSNYEPCAGKRCGEGCKACDPTDNDCSETAVEKYCTADGRCTPNAAETNCR